jgi:type I restriction enzyme S subunit
MANKWRTALLGDLTVNHDGKRKPVKESDRRPGPFPYYGASGVVDYVDGYLFDGDYLLIAEDGENLRTRQTPIAFMARGKSWVNNHAHIVTGNDKTDTRFLMYAIAGIDISGYLTGAVMPKLTQGNLNRIEINCPPLCEQRAIAHILGALDDKIEINCKQSEALEAMVRTLFKAWFVDFEPVRAKMEGRWQRGQSLPGLPAHLYDSFPGRLIESELGEIPEGWLALPVHDIATYVNGAAFKAFQPNDERRGLPIIKIAELKAGITAQTKFSDVEMPGKYLLCTGDILFSWSGNPDTSIDTFIWPHGDAWLNQHIFRVDIHNPGERAFVIATLKYLRPVFAELARNKQTTGLGHVTVGDMQRLLVVKPDEQGLDAWDRVAGPIFSAVFRNELNAISLGKLRDTLLPKLISGELRVPDAERIVRGMS